MGLTCAPGEEGTTSLSPGRKVAALGTGVISFALAEYVNALFKISLQLALSRPST